MKSIKPPAAMEHTIGFCDATSLRDLHRKLAACGVSAPTYEEFFAPLDTKTRHPDGRRLEDCSVPVTVSRKILIVRLNTEADEIKVAASLDGMHYASANPWEALTCALDPGFWTVVVHSMRIVVLAAKHMNQYTKPDFLCFRRSYGIKMLEPYGSRIKVFPANTWFLAKKKEE